MNLMHSDRPIHDVREAQSSVEEAVDRIDKGVDRIVARMREAEAKVDRYESALREIARGNVTRDEYTERRKAIARRALEDDAP